MIAAIARRLAWTVAVVLFAVTATFVILHAIPGDPARVLVGPHASEQALAHARAYHGLDQPLPRQYLRYLVHIASGDFGQSYRSQRPVRSILADSAGPTLLLATSAVVLQAGLGILLGIWAVRRARRWPDRALTVASIVGLSAPPFVVATVLLYTVGFRLGWLPLNGYGSGPGDRLLHLILPALALATYGIAACAQLVRAELRTALAQDFVRTARAKGASERAVLWRHALRPSAPPIISALGVELGALLTGSVVVESIFGWPGMGREALQAVLELDIPLVLGVVIVTSIAIAIINLLADLAVLAIDPRGRE